MSLQINLLKQQLNIDPGFDLDDDLLSHKLDAAQSWIASYIGVPFDPNEAAQVEAALQLAAHWYEQREAALFGSQGRVIPFGVHELLSPFRLAVTGKEQSDDQ